MSVHDGAKDLGTHVHEHHTSLLVGIGEISTFGDRDTLAAVPLFMVGIAKEEVINVFVDVSEIGG